MEEITTEATPREYEGAASQLTEEEINEASAAVDPENLPMIVWLRGDEPYVEQFNLDADAAMEQLGIKRSRLTQISGKELRVGRIRIDRYTRPVYRAEDIEAYKSWSRAPATHQRSSSVINEAADELATRSEKMAAELKDTLANYSAHFEKTVEHLKRENMERQEKLLRATTDITESIKHRFLEATAQHYQEMEQRFSEMSCEFDSTKRKLDSLDQLNARSAGQEEIQALLKQEITVLQQRTSKLTDVVKSQVDIIADFKSTQSAFNRDIGKALSLIIQFQRENTKKQDETQELVKQRTPEPGTKQDVPLPRQRRRTPVVPGRRPRL